MGGTQTEKRAGTEEGSPTQSYPRFKSIGILDWDLDSFGVSLTGRYISKLREVSMAEKMAVRKAKAALEEAENKLKRVKQWIRELDQRLGRRGVGEFLVAVQRPERTLYRIALLQSRSPEVEDLVTVIYRPEVTHAQ